MANFMYGIVYKDGSIDVSHTVKGAKNYATRHGYTKVSRINEIVNGKDRN